MGRRFGIYSAEGLFPGIGGDAADEKFAFLPGEVGNDGLDELTGPDAGEFCKGDVEVHRVLLAIELADACDKHGIAVLGEKILPWGTGHPGKGQGGAEYKRELGERVLCFYAELLDRSLSRVARIFALFFPTQF